MNIRGTDHFARERHKTFWYYLDELSIFIVLVMAIFASNLIGNAHRRAEIGVDDWIKVVEAIIAGAAAYGAMDTKWRVNDGNKPPWLKRATKAIAYGISADTIAGWAR